MTRRRRSAALTAVLLVAAACAPYRLRPGTDEGPVADPTSTTVPDAPRGDSEHPCTGASGSHVEHVIWIWMENHRRDQALDPANAPFTASLAGRCANATDYRDVGSPSLPNYLGATSGSTHGIQDDREPDAH